MITYFADTFYFLALLNADDGMVQTHVTAQGWLGRRPKGDAPKAEAGALGAR